MARPSGEELIRLPVAEIVETSGRAFDKAAKQVAAEIEAYMISKMSRPCDRSKGGHSRPGQYPKMEKGWLVEGIRVTGSRNGIGVYCREPYGRYLDEGTENMQPRPWAMRALEARDWMERIANLAREYTGGSRRRSK